MHGLPSTDMAWVVVQVGSTSAGLSSELGGWQLGAEVMLNGVDVLQGIQKVWLIHGACVP